MTRPDRISTDQLLNEIIPRLTSSERLVSESLTTMIAHCKLPADKGKYQHLKLEFELELSMIRMNMTSLMRRHAQVVERARKGDIASGRAMLDMDQSEAIAIESVETIYRRLREIQIEE